MTTSIPTYRKNIGEFSSNLQKAEQDIINRYSDCTLSPLDIIKIRQAETESARCEGCTGYPCRKSLSRGFKPIIKVEGKTISVKSTLCQYARTSREQARLNRNFAAAKIPTPYIGKTFDDYEKDDENEVGGKGGNILAIGWARNAVGENEGMYLYGAPGCGKTFLASIVAQEFLKKGKTVIFCDVPSLLETLKSTFDDDSNASIEKLMTNLTAADVLVLDDLGTETPTEWAVERLYMIVNQRYNEGKILVVTSNLGTVDVEYKLNHPRNAPVGVQGSRIISRIKQMCRITKIEGGDRRRR